LPFRYDERVNTRLYRVAAGRPDPEAVEAAARALRDGLLVVFPTETVYGWAVRADEPAAVRALREAKGRDGEKPLTLHLPTVAALEARFGPLPTAAARLSRRRLPGPFTLVLPDPAGGTTGVRVPDDPVARAVLEAARCPVAATSVNPAGEAPAVTGSDAAITAAGRTAVVLDAGPCRIGRPSTVLRFGGDRVEVLREGAVPAREALEDSARILLFVCTGNLCRSPLAAAMAAASLARRRGCSAADLPSFGTAVLSAGTGADAGRKATPETVAEGRSRGLDLSGHRSRPLTPALIDRADAVFVMESAHRASILEFAPEAAGRVFLLDPSGRDVPDPFGRGPEAYDASARILEAVVEERVAAEASRGGSPPR
jgi:tRNA threonylcarbamoyl adenosine modification protein (Sua5/YciO/YrdC/YwlC family)